MLCDIGNGTMNVMYINEFRPVLGGCYTEKFGTHQCMLAVRENVLRLNLEKEADREAWGHLRRVDRKQYHSVNSAVIAAVNAYFSRKEQLEADPYLETREKEDAFLEKVMETLQEGLRQATVPGLVPLLQPLQGAQAGTPAPAKEPEANTGTDWDAALDCAGSFGYQSI